MYCLTGWVDKTMHKLYFASYITAVGPLNGAKRVKNVAIWDGKQYKNGQF